MGIPGTEAVSIQQAAHIQASLYRLSAETSQQPARAITNDVIESSAHFSAARRSSHAQTTAASDDVTLERGIVPPQILSCCKILSTRLLALQCRKMCFLTLQQDFYSKSHHASPPRLPVRSTPMGATRTLPVTSQGVTKSRPAWWILRRSAARSTTTACARSLSCTTKWTSLIGCWPTCCS